MMPPTIDDDIGDVDESSQRGVLHFRIPEKINKFT